jgi:hypothetical protein
MFWSKGTSNSTMHLGRARLQLVEAAHHDHLGRDAGGRGRARAAQGGQHDFLGDAGRTALVIDHFAGLDATHPMGHLDGLQRHLGAELAQLVRNLGDGGGGAGGARQARADQVGQVFQAPIGIIALHRRVAHLGQRGRIIARCGSVCAAGGRDTAQQAGGKEGQGGKAGAAVHAIVL